MERFVGMLVAGGVSLVVGCWLAALFVWGSTVWFVGVGLAVLGAVALGAGILSEIE